MTARARLSLQGRNDSLGTPRLHVRAPAAKAARMMFRPFLLASAALALLACQETHTEVDDNPDRDPQAVAVPSAPAQAMVAAAN
ncbi:MAG: hypothetical protein WBF53_16190, partial [Litorimonas sp.]